MASSINWADGPGGGTPLSAANLAKLAVVADVGTPGTPTGDALRAAFATKQKLRSAALAGQLAPPSTVAFPTALATAPTYAYSGSTSLPLRMPLNSANLRVSQGLDWNATYGRWRLNWPTTLDFVLTGTTFEFQWTANGNTGSDLFWLWVDGKPTTAAPASSGQTTSLGTTVVSKLTFPDAGPRRIALYMDGVNSLYEVRLALTSSISSAPAPLKGLFVSDSFWGGANGVAPFSTAAGQISRILGVDMGNISEGGTGWVSHGASFLFGDFGNAAKVPFAQRYAPDFIVFQGSVNDDGLTGVGAAVTAALNAYATACPGVPFIVFGPQPTNATDTLSANRQASNAAVMAAATAHPSVIAFHDEIGHAAGMPAAFAGATFYNQGDLMTYAGAVWKCSWPGGDTGSNLGAPGIGPWEKVTFLYSGTGNAGSPAGDGSRDLFLSNDNVHPTLLGHTAMATRLAGLIRADLLAYALA